MLPATDQELEHVREYMKSEAPDLTVEFAQKIYSEIVLGTEHDVWDVRTNVDRWWVITTPMNLYSQEQFPSMDLALTFHVGLSLRVPRGARQELSDIPAEPFSECFRILQEASDALDHAQEVTDYQAIGMRCREAVLAFIRVAETVLPWTSTLPGPKKADVNAWSEHICNFALAGESHKYRRQLFKTLLESAWKFDNWLTHTKCSKWHDAEAALSVTENALGLCVSAVVQHIRGVPEQCPSCGSQRLSPQRRFSEDAPGTLWERPCCDKCGWTGRPVQIENVATVREELPPEPTSGECVQPTIPLMHLKRP